MIETGLPQRIIRGPNCKPFFDGVTQPEHRHVLRPVLSDRGHTREEAAARIAGRLNRQNFVLQSRQVFTIATIAEPVVVSVAIDHAGKDRCAGIVMMVDRCAVGRTYLVCGPDAHDLGAAVRTAPFSMGGPPLASITRSAVRRV